MKTLNRRKFLKVSTTAVSSFMIVTRSVLGGKGYIPPSDKLNIAAIGIGGQGAWDLENLASENIVAKNIHPTVKPLKLMSYLITLGSREKDIILDPFAGSGTTCIAAQQLGR